MIKWTIIWPSSILSNDSTLPKPTIKGLRMKMISLLIHHYSSGTFRLILEIPKNLSKRKKLLNQKNLTKTRQPVPWKKRIRITCLAPIHHIIKQSYRQKRVKKARKMKFSKIKRAQVWTAINLTTVWQVKKW
jgi:hypothetical protein